MLRDTFDKGITNNEIKSIAYVLCRHCPPLRVDRDAQRDGRVLIKWFQENIELIQPQLAHVGLLDEEKRAVADYQIGL